MASPLASRIALITGASSGLGRATAEHFVQKGARVILCDLPGSNGLETERELSQASSAYTKNAIFVPTNVTSEEQVADALDAGEKVFGRPVDTVINCAGIGLACKTVSSKRGRGGNDDANGNGNALEWRVHDFETFRKVLDTNVSGTFNVVRLAVERMVKARSDEAYRNGPEIPDGVIVNTASIAAYDGQIGQVAYAASKGAIVGMTLPLARDLAEHGIRTNAIAPGLFRTPLLEGLPEEMQRELGSRVPFPSRLGDPFEFAMLVQSVVENPMINGEVIRIDGGLRMPPK